MPGLLQGLDFIVDAGTRVADPSTVVDMTGSIPTIVRQGKVCATHPEYLSAMLDAMFSNSILLSSI